jgi:hypothetical protein
MNIYGHLVVLILLQKYGMLEIHHSLYLVGRLTMNKYQILDGHQMIGQLYGQLIINWWHFGIYVKESQNMFMVDIYKGLIKWLFIRILQMYLLLLMKIMLFMYFNQIEIINEYVDFLWILLFLYLKFKVFLLDFYWLISYLKS